MPIDRVIDLATAYEMVAKNDVLPGDTNYWLAKMFALVKARHKAFITAREVERSRIAQLQENLISEKKEGWQIKVSNLDAEYVRFVDSLKESIRKDEKSPKIEHRGFKKSEFEAKEDFERIRPSADKPVTIKFKKGDSLVPPEFFLLMDDMIEE